MILSDCWMTLIVDWQSKLNELIKDKDCKSDSISLYENLRVVIHGLHQNVSTDGKTFVINNLYIHYEHPIEVFLY